jgi:hypothetical protein
MPVRLPPAPLQPKPAAQPGSPEQGLAKQGLAPAAGTDAGNDWTAGQDLLPPAARAAGPDEQAGTGGSRREPAGHLTIGTIEVTVVPPARQARGAGEPRPAAPSPALAPRPAAGLAEAGSARLRDGLRRWYGIAQG